MEKCQKVWKKKLRRADTQTLLKPVLQWVTALSGTLCCTQKAFFCRARAFLTSAVFMIHVSGFIVLKHICGAQTPFFLKIFPFTFGVTYFCSELECDLVFAFFQIMRCTLDNDQYSLVVSHGWNVDIWCSRFGCVFQRLVCKTEPIKNICCFLFGFVGDAVQAQFWSQTWIWHIRS